MDCYEKAKTFQKDNTKLTTDDDDEMWRTEDVVNCLGCWSIERRWNSSSISNFEFSSKNWRSKSSSEKSWLNSITMKSVFIEHCVLSFNCSDRYNPFKNTNTFFMYSVSLLSQKNFIEEVNTEMESPPFYNKNKRYRIILSFLSNFKNSQTHGNVRQRWAFSQAFFNILRRSRGGSWLFKKLNQQYKHQNQKTNKQTNNENFWKDFLLENGDVVN